MMSDDPLWWVEGAHFWLRKRGARGDWINMNWTGKHAMPWRMVFLYPDSKRMEVAPIWGMPPMLMLQSLRALRALWLWNMKARNG